jgi:hypothetical protein
MNRSIVSTILISAMILSLSSCKKKSSDDNPTPANNNSTNTQTSTDPKIILTSHSWKLNSINWGGELASTCDKDNVYTFKSNGTGYLYDGVNKCNFSTPDTTQLTWSILNTNKFILKKGSSTPDTNTIVSITDSEFIYDSKPTFGTSERTTLIK